MSNISQIQVNNTTYDIKDAVARDEKINKSAIAEPYDNDAAHQSTILENGGKLYSTVIRNADTFPEKRGVEPVKVCDVFKRTTVVNSMQDLQETYIPLGTFVYVTTDEDERIKINNVGFPNVYVYTKQSDGIQRASITINGTTDETSQVIRFGWIIARNELTGIDSIDDANQLLKVEKINEQYVVTYQYAEDKGTDYIATYINNSNVFKKGTSPIMYARAYLVFKNLNDNTETIMYTPCQKVTWAEWEETQS